MKLGLEEIIIYASVFLFSVLVVLIYLRVQKRSSSRTLKKINEAKEAGLFEPVSLHPVVDPNSCIRTGACISACPEKDILGIFNGKATVINASQCIGHGACFHACPTEAITLCIGTEKRGVDLPHVSATFETNVPGIYIAGELGGMGLIKNAVEQGKQAVENISKKLDRNHKADYDLLIVGLGPAGISASLAARKNKLKALTIDQHSLGGTVYTFPRKKIVMTAPMDLPLLGKIKLYETSKAELLGLWERVIQENNVEIVENAKVESIAKTNDHFETTIFDGRKISSQNVLLAIGRRGSPRKLNIPGEDSETVAYKLLEPELITDQRVVVVGGGDSAIEAALSLADRNKVLLSYRGDAFKRLKPKNRELLLEADKANKINIRLNSTILSIADNEVILNETDGEQRIGADQVYIFAGGELPTEFLKNIGIIITRKFGETILKH
jgi:thioredoxin reductase/ferredoxin